MGLSVQFRIDFQDGNCGGHLVFPIGTILAISWIYKSPWCFLRSFASVGLTVQKKKRKRDFQDIDNAGHLGFQIGTILALFYLQSPWCFLPSVESSRLSVQDRKRTIDFQDGSYGGQLAFPIGKIWALFNLQVMSMFPTKFYLVQLFFFSVKQKKWKIRF